MFILFHYILLISITMFDLNERIPKLKKNTHTQLE